MILTSVDAVDETPIDRYLAEQRDLTAVERFARRHESELLHRQSRYYRDLIPATPPAPGQQYAFEVDLDSCTGCKACVAACHTLNGLDHDESWRSVQVLHGGATASAWQQTVTTACHHCVDPACLSGCPVDAYEKDPVTGIVSHLDDQCIGCSYCTLTCPYEVPVYNHARGIVRKCDLCRGRLDEGEAPACVQACPNGAIRVSIVDVAVLMATAEAGARVPGGPPSSITVPATTYRTSRPARLEETRPVTPTGHARSHLPLVVMLVLTQLAVGAFVVDLVVRLFGSGSQPSVGAFDALLALGVGALALGASVFHLGRPWLAYRAVIGFRHSWLSREVLAFGAFTALTAAYALVVAFVPGARTSAPVWVLGGLVAAAGLAGVTCSIFVYVVTRRAAWRLSISAPLFVLTAAVGGLATVWWATLVSAVVSSSSSAGDAFAALGRPLPYVLAGCILVKLVVEAAAVRRVLGLGRGRPGVVHRLDADLRPVVLGRVACGVSGGVVLPLLGATLAGASAPSWPVLALGTVAAAVLVVGELLERVAFFAISAPPR